MRMRFKPGHPPLMNTRPLTFFLLHAASVSAYAQTAEVATSVRDTMRSYVDRGAIAGAVALAAHNGRITVLEAVGWQDLAARTAMRPTTIFQLRSMTKTLTAIAVMRLVDGGQIELDDPVAEYIAEFAGSPITIRELLSHTSGIPAEIPSSMRGRVAPLRSLADYAAIVAQLDRDEAGRFLYSDQNYYLLGRVIEVASGEPYEAFVQRSVFDPLGMKDSFVLPRADAWDRVASTYERSEGALRKSSFYDVSTMQWLHGSYPRPSWSMFSTASDVFALYQMLLNGGVYQNERVLSPESVRLMTRPHASHIGSLLGSVGYGFGLNVTESPDGGLWPQTVGSYGHGGLLGTVAWADPQLQLIRVYLVSLAPRSEREAFLREDRRVVMTLLREAAPTH